MNNSRTRKANIRDVAREAGVSIKTVSRVLNKERYVSEVLQAKVQRAVAKLRYSPNLQARGLAARRSYMVGLLVDDIVGDYIDRIQQGMLRACAEEGNHLVVELLSQRGVAETDERVRDLLSRINFDGMVMTPPVCDDLVVLRNLQEFGVPAVRIGGGREVRDMGLGTVDNFRAARDVTNHLIAKGHASIGFVKGDPEHDCSDSREQGFLHAMQSAKLTVRTDWMLSGMFSFNSGVEVGREIIKLKQMPTAFFASSDSMAAGIADVLKRHGVRIPDDVSLVGFDDDAICIEMTPKLTTIRQPVAEMALEATRRIIAARAGGAALTSEPVIFEYALIERESVADLRHQTSVQ